MQNARSDPINGCIHTLLKMKPDFVAKHREYMKPLVVLDEHTDMIWDGLCKAGIRSS